MKILITGACGHIGSFLAENVNKIKSISKTILVDNLKSGRFYSLYNLEKKNNLSFFLRDLNNLDTLNDFQDVNAIIHCASMTNAEKSFEKEKEMYRNNLNCLKTVMKYCQNRNTKLIHISSASVYGKQGGIVDENCEKRFLNPQSPYAKIKLIEEKLLKKNSNKLKYNTFRFGTIAGISKGIGFHTAVNSFCFNAAIGEKIRVYKTALHQYRPYLSIRDSFKIFKYCLEKNFFDNDIFNALSGNFTVNQILNKIRKIKKKINIIYVNSPIMNRLSYRVDDKKIKSKGLILKSNIDVDIKDTLLLFKYLKNEM